MEALPQLVAVDGDRTHAFVCGDPSRCLRCPHADWLQQALDEFAAAGEADDELLTEIADAAEGACVHIDVLASLTSVAHLADDHPRLARALGMAHVGARSWEAAATHLRAAGPVSSPVTTAYLAIALAGSGAAADAIETSDAAVASDPASGTVHQLRGDMFGVLGRWKDAASAYATALEHEPDDPAIHAAQALALRRSRRPRAAGRAVTRAIELDSGHQAGWIVAHRLAAVHRRQWLLLVAAPVAPIMLVGPSVEALSLAPLAVTLVWAGIIIHNRLGMSGPVILGVQAGARSMRRKRWRELLS